jgi:hypothetical protein
LQKSLCSLNIIFFQTPTAKPGNWAAIEDHPSEVVPLLQTSALVEPDTKRASSSPAGGVVIGGAVLSDPCLDRAFVALSADGKVR